MRNFRFFNDKTEIAFPASDRETAIGKLVDFFQPDSYFSSARGVTLLHGSIAQPFTIEEL